MLKQILIEYHTKIDVVSQLKTVQSEMDSGKYKSLLFHVYSGILDEKILISLCRDLKSEFPDCVLVGSVSAGEIIEGRLMDKGVLISAMLFEQTDIRFSRFDDVNGREKEVGQQIASLINETEHIKAVEVLLPGTEINTRFIWEAVSASKQGVQVFGGYAGGHDMNIGEHYVFDEQGLTDNTLYLVSYVGENFHINVDKSVGWQTLGHAFKVTKSDENRLIEINNIPAVEIYEKYLQINRNDNFEENTFEFPLIAKTEGDELLRHTLNVEPDGTLDMAGYVTEGMDIYLCYGNPGLIVEGVNKRLKEVADFRPEAILLYSCSVRKSFWENYVNIEMIPFQKIAETSGFHTWGEVKRDPRTGNVWEYNITLLSIAMREGDRPEGDLGEIVVDDSVLKGQASLIKRLSQLVSATTSELQNAYDDLEKVNEQLRILSNHDALTGLYNRRRLDEFANDVIDTAEQTGADVTMLMLDIDYFKNVNDTYGHDVGDGVLVEIAHLLDEHVSSHAGAAVGRWGGEEFLAVIPNMESDQAFEYSEEIRKAVEAHKHKDIPERITISIGCLCFRGKVFDRTKLFKDVDDCLYEAKRRGRNRVIQTKL